MGWSSANSIFDPVARTFIDCDVPAETRTRVLAVLIKALQDGDWDTADESLDEFKHDLAIVDAFRQNGIYLTCDAESDDRWCEKEHGHQGDHSNWNGETWPQTAEAG